MIDNLKQYVIDNEYDTEGLEMDLQINDGNGNISKYINDKNCVDNIISMFDQSRSMYFVLIIDVI